MCKMLKNNIVVYSACVDGTAAMMCAKGHFGGNATYVKDTELGNHDFEGRHVFMFVVNWPDGVSRLKPAANVVAFKRSEKGVMDSLCMSAWNLFYPHLVAPSVLRYIRDSVNGFYSLPDSRLVNLGFLSGIPDFTNPTANPFDYKHYAKLGSVDVKGHKSGVEHFSSAEEEANAVVTPVLIAVDDIPEKGEPESVYVGDN